VKELELWVVSELGTSFACLLARSYQLTRENTRVMYPPNAGATDGRGSGHAGVQVLVVGAGLSGAVIAREVAETGKQVLVIDKRDHVAGNCFDYVDKTGFRVAEYGPHFFHTNSERVKEYVHRFSEWVPWEHRVTARVTSSEGAPVHVPVPVNITSVNALFGTNITTPAAMDEWLKTEQIPCEVPKDSRDVALSRVGLRLYDLLFKGYTKKQWDKWPEELEASVLARIPVRNNFDDRYFTDSFQALPRHGYTKFISNILDHPNIEVRTGVDYFAEAHAYKGFERLYYTGPIDRYYAHLNYEPLEYRTVTFDQEVKTTAADECLQPTSQVRRHIHARFRSDAVCFSTCASAAG
jgi:UDP-galactopyranose mutase